jgi:hypothetical protein
MGFWWDFRRRRSSEVLEYLGPSTSSSLGSPSLSESKDRGMPEVLGGLPEAADLCSRECPSGWPTSKRCERLLWLRFGKKLSEARGAGRKRKSFVIQKRLGLLRWAHPLGPSWASLFPLEPPFLSVPVLAKKPLEEQKLP